MLRAPIASVLLVFLSFAAAPAQEPSRADSILTPDRRLRLTVDGRNWVTGEFQRVAARQLELRPAGADSVARYPLASLTELEVSEGTTNAALPGALVGALAGGVAGFFIGVGLHQAVVDCSAPDAGDLCGLGVIQYMLVGTTVGVGVGGLTGYLIGSNIEQERWALVPLESIRVSISGGSGLGLAVSLTPAR